MNTIIIIASYAESIILFRGELIDALLSKGLGVHVAAPSLSAEHPVARQLASKGVTSHEIKLSRTGMNPFADLKTVFELILLIRRIQPTWLLAYTIKPVVYGLLAGRLVGVPHRFALISGLGYTFQGEAGSGRSKVRWLVQRLYAAALSGAHKVFFQNPDDEFLFRSFAILPKPIPSCVVNGSGVSVEHFGSTSLPVEPRFLLIARLLGDKGVREYAEAASRLKQRYPQAVFRLGGWIDENPDAIRPQELDGWTTAGVIDFLGKLGDVRPAIEDCSVYVLPSYREGTPRTVLEAMAMGRPVITTDAPGCRETVVDGYNGFLVPVKSVDSLVEAMERFILDSDLAAIMGKRSREIAVERYDVHKVNTIMLSEMGIK